MNQFKITQNNFFILTGGPGSGKTSVLNELEKYNHTIIPEVARSIIKTQLDTGGTATHTGDRKAFCDFMLEQSLLDYKNSLMISKTVFFDRGIPDLYGYAQRFCDGVTREINDAIQKYRYNPTVFIFPPWPEIYKQDSERKQDFNEAIDTYQAIKEAYITCDYHLIELPRLSISERVDFILQQLT